MVKRKQAVTTPAEEKPAKSRGPRKGGAKSTRQQMLDAAVKVIGRKGYSGATIDEIVEEAGVSKGLAYYHFKGKAEIALSILEDRLGSLIDSFEEIAAVAPDAPAAMNGMIECFAEKIFENEEFGRFFVSELWREERIWSEEMRVIEDRLLQVLRTQLRRGIGEGVFRGDIDPDFEAVALVGMVLTTTLYYIGEKDDANQADLIQKITDFARRAMAAQE